MSNTTWVKTSDLVDQEFHITDVGPRSYRRWDDVNSRFEFSKEPEKGFSPFWNIEIDQGTWSASPGQYGQILIAAESKGLSDVLGKTFRCKSNGKTGKDIRYFFDLVTE
jgi:hypothetical protein